MEPLLPNSEQLSSDPYLQPVATWLARSVGAVLACIGALLCVLLIWAASRIAAQDRTIEPVVPIVGAAILFVALFCCIAGARLLLNKPNRHGSILPPLGWYAMAFASSASAVTITVTALRGGHFPEPIGLVCILSFAFWCYRAARRLHSTSPRGRNAL